MYKLLRAVLFLFPPEKVHYFSMNALSLLCSIGFIRKLLVKNFNAKKNQQSFGKLRTICNLKFKNPVGLGAGFDKNARYLRELACLGFGFVEIGTVTPLPQAGNPKPRLFRLPKDKALINRMGFNNDGVKKITERLKSWCEYHSRLTIDDSRLIIGGNIGKNKTTPNEEAWKDYEICFKELHPYVDYFVVNVSSPNTPGLRELQEKESLKKILLHLQMINKTMSEARPIFLKIAPDLTNEQLNDVIELAMEINLDGIVATNTTISREGVSRQSAVNSRQSGGLSGLPLKKRSTEVVRIITEKTNGHIPVIASGGIFNADDAREKLAAGASLIQVWTGFIYEGPGIAKRIAAALS